MHLSDAVVETLTFHLGITTASAVVLSSLALVRRTIFKSAPSSSLTEQFRYVQTVSLGTPFPEQSTSYAQIPLALLYSSLPKLFLLALLSLWRPVMPEMSEEVRASGAILINEAIAKGSLRPLVSILDDDVLDREWVVRNVLGGMAAGFGLRGSCSQKSVSVQPLMLSCSRARLSSDVHEHRHPNRMGAQDAGVRLDQWLGGW